jgi:hypothetical protein
MLFGRKLFHVESPRQLSSGFGKAKNRLLIWILRLKLRILRQLSWLPRSLSNWSGYHY